LLLLKLLQKYEGFKTSQVLRDLSDLLLSFTLHHLRKDFEFYHDIDKLFMLAKTIQRVPNESLKVEVRDRIKRKIEGYEEGEPERDRMQAKYNEIYINHRK
jgi:hypothetical protein